jgi:hypothetical protein
MCLRINDMTINFKMTTNTALVHQTHRLGAIVSAMINFPFISTVSHYLSLSSS